METQITRGLDEPVTIPVLVDAIRNFDDTPMARCSYFVVEADEASTGWTLDLLHARVPFVMLGISAVIHRGTGGEPRFEDSDTIEALYDAIESQLTLSIQTSDLWLPVFVLAGSRELGGIERGQVFRVDSELFELAQSFVVERISQETFLESARAMIGRASASPTETRAFEEWSAAQIQAARDLYPKSPELELDWYEASS